MNSRRSRARIESSTGVSNAGSARPPVRARDHSSRLRLAVRRSLFGPKTGHRRRHELRGREDRLRTRVGESRPRAVERRRRPRRRFRPGERQGVRGVLQLHGHRLGRLRGSGIPCAPHHLAPARDPVLRSAAGPSRVHAPGRASAGTSAGDSSEDSATRPSGVHASGSPVHASGSAPLHAAGADPDAGAPADAAPDTDSGLESLSGQRVDGAGRPITRGGRAGLDTRTGSERNSRSVGDASTEDLPGASAAGHPYPRDFRRETISASRLSTRASGESRPAAVNI